MRDAALPHVTFTPLRYVWTFERAHPAAVLGLCSGGQHYYAMLANQQTYMQQRERAIIQALEHALGLAAQGLHPDCSRSERISVRLRLESSRHQTWSLYLLSHPLLYSNVRTE